MGGHVNDWGGHRSLMVSATVSSFQGVYEPRLYQEGHPVYDSLQPFPTSLSTVVSPAEGCS